MGRTRRELLRDAAATGALVTGAPLLAACAPAAPTSGPSAVSQSAAATLPPPETQTIRVPLAAACDPWCWMAEAFLREEGFTDIRFPVDKNFDIGTTYVNAAVTSIDAGQSGVAVAGLHTGCLEIFARPGIATIADLRGRTIPVTRKTFTFQGVTAPDLFYGLWLGLLAHVGMQPSEANFVEIGANGDVLTEFFDGRADAIITIAAQGPIVHANPRNPGHVILDTTTDKPWSQQYCCLLVGDENWAKANPVALKRATRAILRTIDQTARDRRTAPRVAIDKGLYRDRPQITERVLYDTIKDLSYDWRDYDPGESIRFYALRLADAKLIKKTPQQIVDATDFSWFRQLQKEFKG